MVSSFGFSFATVLSYFVVKSALDHPFEVSGGILLVIIPVAILGYALGYWAELVLFDGLLHERIRENNDSDEYVQGSIVDEE
jgi:hypothetical protein